MIAHWMLYCLAVGALLSLAALAMERAMRAFARPQRFVWAAAMVLMLAIPAAARWLPRAESPASAAEIADAGVQILRLADAPAAVPAGRPRIDAAALDRPLAMGWMGLSAAALLALIAAWAVLERRQRGWRAARVDGVPVLLSPSTGPAVIGLFRSRIVLPRWVVEDAPEDVRALLLEHEQEHLRAGDPRLLALGLAAVALMPWNPAAWWQLRRLRLAVEVDCDARVLARRADVRAYGALLLEVGRRGAGGRLLVAAFSEPRSFLERRIRMMTSPRARRPLLGAAGFGAMAALLVAASWRAPQPARPLSAAVAVPAETQETPRETVRRLYPAIARGTGDTATVLLAYSPTGALADHRMTVRGHPAGVPMPASVRQGGRLQMYDFAAGDLGPDPVRVFVLRQLAQKREAAGASAETDAETMTDTVMVPGSAAPGDTVRPVLVNEQAVSRALQRLYPPLLREAGVRGSAQVRLRVTAQGVPSELHAVEASHPEFGEAAVLALAAARFRPASSDGAAVAYTLTLPVQFAPGEAERPKIDGRVVQRIEGPWDQPPEPLSPEMLARALDDEYPPLLREAGISARAQVLVRIAATGQVLHTESVYATHPQAGPAAERALARARFRPAHRDGQAIPAETVLSVEFKVSGATGS